MQSACLCHNQKTLKIGQLADFYFCRFCHLNSARNLSRSGCRTTPFSVMSAATSSAGVTSKEGLRIFAPSAAQ